VHISNVLIAAVLGGAIDPVVRAEESDGSNAEKEVGNMIRFMQIALLFLIVFSSCATNSGNVKSDVDNNKVRTERYHRACQSWIGHDINELIRAWGYPQQTNEMPNGNKLVTYQKSSSMAVSIPGTTTSTNIGNMRFQDQSPGMNTVLTFYCNTSFEIDRNGKVIYWRAEGNSCFAD
jgi:hypothetical protein